MSDTIISVYPRLAALPEIVQLVTTMFPHDGPEILTGMKAGTDLGRHADELEDFLTEFVLNDAEVVTSYKGLAVSDASSAEAMAYFEAHHPEVHRLLHAQAQEQRKLLEKDGAAIALGQAREPFDIDVLSWKGVCVVTAEDFEDTWFAEEQEAITFAENNYEPFIKNAAQ